MSLQLIQWQILDSLLPTGGFAHSYGLEAALQSTIMHSGDSAVHKTGDAQDPAFDKFSITQYIINITEAIAAFDLPYVAHCHLHFEEWSKDTDSAVQFWTLLDELTNASLTNHIMRRAASSQGTALLRLAAEGALGASAQFTERFKAIKKAMLKFDGHGYAAPIFGMITASLGVPVIEAQRMYLFMAHRDVLSAAVRLSIFGPMGSAKLQSRLASHIETILQAYKDAPLGQVHQCFPVGDAVQGCHDKLYSRLFNS